MKIIALTLVLMGASASPAEPYDEATKKLGEALVVYTGLDKDVDRFIKRTLPPEAVKFAEQWGTVGKLVTEKRLELKWTW